MKCVEHTRDTKAQHIWSSFINVAVWPTIQNYQSQREVTFKTMIVCDRENNTNTSDLNKRPEGANCAHIMSVFSCQWTGFHISQHNSLRFLFGDFLTCKPRSFVKYWTYVMTQQKPDRCKFNKDSSLSFSFPRLFVFHLNGRKVNL